MRFTNWPSVAACFLCGNAGGGLELLSTHYSLPTISLQYPQPPFVYSIGWTSR